MAIVNRNSSAIADFVAVPRVPVSPHKGGQGDLKEVAGYVTPAADDSATSVYRFCRLPSNAAVRSVQISNAAATTAGSIDIGIHQTNDNGGAVVDQDFFASALALTAAKSNAEQIDESAEFTLDEQFMPLWQALGLSVDPHRDYDVTATVITAFSGGPTKIKIRVQFVK